MNAQSSVVCSTPNVTQRSLKQSWGITCGIVGIFLSSGIRSRNTSICSTILIPVYKNLARLLIICSLHAMPSQSVAGTLFLRITLSGIMLIHPSNILIISLAFGPPKNVIPSSRTRSLLYMFGFGPFGARLMICRRLFVTKPLYDFSTSYSCRRLHISLVCHLTKFIHTPFVKTVTYSLAAWLKVCVRPESSPNDAILLVTAA